MCKAAQITLFMVVVKMWKSHGILIEIVKTAENSDVYLSCHAFNLEDPAAHLKRSDPSGILKVEK